MLKSRIDSYCFGETIIDNISDKKDLIIESDGVLPNWERGKGHKVSFDDLGTVLRNPPKILIIGTGYCGRVEVDGSIINTLDEHGIQLIHQKTSTAWITYIELAMDYEVIAALHLTC